MKKYIFSFALFFVIVLNNLCGQTYFGFEDATLAVNGGDSDCIEKSGCLYNSHGTPNVFTGNSLAKRPTPYEGTKMAHIWSQLRLGYGGWQEGIFISDLKFVKNIS